MFTYIAYGLGIQSVLPLPELVAGEAAVDVVIRVGKVDCPPLTVDAVGGGFWATTDQACHFLEGVGAFLARGGREIVVAPAPGVEERLLRLSILGPALALILQQRGRLILHASAVEVAGVAVAFLGASGWGKSTLAAVMHSRGHELMADDLTVIDIETDIPVVFPGVPQLKLWPDTVVALGEVPEILPQLHPLFEKRARRIIRKFSQRPLDLKCIYVLAVGSVAAIEPLCPQEALRDLIRHWYGARFGMELLQLVGLPSFFLQCATLARTIPVYRLQRPPSLPTLPVTAQLVEEHLAPSGRS